MQVGLSNCQTENSYVVRRADNKNIQENSAKKYSNVAEYYAYLKDKYSCLSASGYKVNISPALLEKCINDPERAELLEKNLEHLPVSHQNMTAFWSARGAEVINEQWNFDENGNCGGGTNMYVSSKGSSTGNSIQNGSSAKKSENKHSPQEIYNKRKREREQFEERQAKKRMIKEQTEEKELKKKTDKELAEKSLQIRKQNTDRAISKYEENMLRT